MRFLLLCLLGSSGTGCGGDEATALLLNVDVSAFQVPGELDSVFVEARDTNDTTRVIGRAFSLEAEQTLLRVELLLGTRLPAAQTLEVQGFLGAQPVATSGPLEALFDPGKVRKLDVSLVP